MEQFFDLITICSFPRYSLDNIFCDTTTHTNIIITKSYSYFLSFSFHFISFSHISFHFISVHFISFHFTADIDECCSNNTCHVNATCSNTPGSFVCSCNEGFEPSADGSECEGLYIFQLILYITFIRVFVIKLKWILETSEDHGTMNDSSGR